MPGFGFRPDVVGMRGLPDLAGIAGLALLLAACGQAADRKGQAMAPDAVAVADVEIFLAERLPPSARAMRAAGERGIDQAFYLAFEAPADEVTVFAGRLGVALTPGDDAAMHLRGPGLDWWTGPLPAGAAVRGGMIDRHADNRHIQMLALALPDGRERVWLAAHSN